MNSVRKQAFLLIGMVFAFVVSPGTLFAAGFDLVKFTTTPTVPGANEDVVVQMQSYAVNLSTANITWYVNKEPVKNGAALTTFNVRTGDFGTKTTIDVIITTAEGMIINKQLVLAPAEVDLLWEAQTYTPPFYKGKALPSYKSLVRVTAIPRFNNLSSDPTHYYYKWTYNQTLGVGEALGRNSVVVPMGYAGTPIPMNVEVSEPGTDWKGSRSIEIPVFEAKVELYEQAPLLGTLFQHVLRPSTETSGTEFVTHAVPYFFSTDDMENGDLTYKWSVDRRPQQTESDPLNNTLARQGDDGQTHDVSLRVVNMKRILQEGQSDGGVLFTSQN